MSEFVDYLQEVFERLGPVSSRKMFGGYGVYHHGVMIALVADETLYLKADAQTRAEFDALGLGPFEYDKGDKVVEMSYFLAPEEIFEDRDTAAEWGRRAYQAALRARASKKKKTR